MSAAQVDRIRPALPRLCKPVSASPILNIAVDVPLSRLFDYLPSARNAEAAVGSRVRVPFGRREQVGLILDRSPQSELPSNKLRSVTDVLDSEALLSPSDLWLIRFASDYYHHPIGEVVAAALPALLRQGKSLYPAIETIAVTDAGESADLDTLTKRAPRQAELLELLIDAGGNGCDAETLTSLLPNWRRAAKGLLTKGLIDRHAVRAEHYEELAAIERQDGPSLNTAQLAALEALRRTDRFNPIVLDGVTGSGKTEVYLQRMQDMIDAGKQVLVLVPEIGLTPQLTSRLRQRLGIEPALLHSGLTDNARLTAWRAARSGAARLVVGTRSAVFTPLKNPGLIVVDEEHDPSFKQQEGLRYSARDLAIARAKHLDIPIVLGSATPSLELMYRCRTNTYEHAVLPARAGGAALPQIRLIDTVRHEAVDGISEPLAAAIDRHLANEQQVLLYLNRRGFAPTLICSSCGYIAGCTRCDSRMTVHSNSRQLRCHHCGANRRLELNCEECGEIAKPLGEGTERLEDTLRLRFPAAAVCRIDSDTTQGQGSMAAALQRASDGDANLLIGTQMLSKGHHFPKLTLVGIVNADQGLFGTDFRSSERLAQSVLQVAGRAGREEAAGEVLIQTAFPDNAFWTTLIDGGYRQIADETLAERRSTHWPPYSRLVLIRAAAHRKSDARRFLGSVHARLSSEVSNTLRILGPVDAPMARRAGRHRAQLLLQSTDRPALHRLLHALRRELENDSASRRVRWSIDVDPIELF